MNGVIAAILRYFTEFGRFGANYVIVVEDRPILYAKMYPKQSTFANITFVARFSEITERESALKRGIPYSKTKILFRLRSIARPLGLSSSLYFRRWCRKILHQRCMHDAYIAYIRLIICPIAIAYSMVQVIKSVCVCVSVCLCVCLSASTLTVAFLDRFSPKLPQT